ncbi:uncharacterized protein SPPG_04980 [Spizellomyces punctatus DAOM BR117]|uniref:RING-type domain-containing protein n=1 Tax=Spizellomyces punctatus (strain DAOM BR117) TaxID=645134 RepID=A0A0L0HFP5_SPIPD|nr:uncharacterized protein SPPG_04980 [Spizellomyces punctatus DAOM BR117]KNC99593.1 hypothetical protein SPPG_04980 [Spizellomyces punctatus DAOM BR117]|eukprot:XP_016607633.1 hypothetical protein SPPG_04980 [Spizellomyces punctatus DAOM BR117]
MAEVITSVENGPSNLESQPQIQPQSESATQEESNTTAAPDSSANPNSAPTHGRRRTFLQKLWLIVETTYNVIHLLILIIFLSLYRSSCDAPLNVYLIGLLVMEVVYGVPAKPIMYFVDRRPEWRTSNVWRRVRKLWGTCAGVDVVWFVVGNVWVFRSQTCKTQNPQLYWLTFAEIIVRYATIVLPLTLFLILLCVFRGRVRRDMLGYPELQTGLTPLELTRLKTFSFNELSLPSQVEIIVDDSSHTPNSHLCSVCLTEYAPHDRLRELACHHRFHKACIDQWLLDDPRTLTGGHRTCPLCVREAIKEEDRDPEWVARKKRADEIERTVEGDMRRAVEESRSEAVRRAEAASGSGEGGAPANAGNAPGSEDTGGEVSGNRESSAPTRADANGRESTESVGESCARPSVEEVRTESIQQT